MILLVIQGCITNLLIEQKIKRAMKTLGRIIGLFLLVGTLSSFDTAEKDSEEYVPFNGSTTIKNPFHLLK